MERGGRPAKKERELPGRGSVIESFVRLDVR